MRRHQPPAADRTRSKRWRSGTRRNKKFRSAHIPVCPSLRWCLVHTTDPDTVLTARMSSYRPALTMKLTICEQKWVDDVRARRPHTHRLSYRNRQQRAAAIRMMDRHVDRILRRLSLAIFGETSSLRAEDNRVKAVSRAVDEMGNTRMFETLKNNAVQLVGDAVHSPGTIGHRARMDISDRWYPRGS